MILFDNMYYLLYNYFKRTNSGKWGYRATAIMLAANYMFFTIIVFLLSIKIGNYFFQGKDLQTLSYVLNNSMWWENKIVFVILSLITCIVSSIRYTYFKKYDQIHEIRNNLKIGKRKVLDDLTIIYLITAPILIFFLADITNDLY